MTAREAEKLLLKAGYVLVRVQGSHHIYKRDSNRVVLPHHAGKILHPKIIKQVIEAISEDPDPGDLDL
jgi:predicted RNA binding protein YcfA (HicA-like mRNA interferase family)